MLCPVLMIICSALLFLHCNCFLSEAIRDSAAEEYKIPLIFMGIIIQFYIMPLKVFRDHLSKPGIALSCVVTISSNEPYW